MARVSVTQHLREMGFNNPRERSRWISDHKVEILDHCRINGWQQTREHFHISYGSLKKLAEGSYTPQKRVPKKKEEAVKLTFEDIVSSAPNTAVLGQLMLDGITTLISEFRDKINEQEAAISGLEDENKELKETVRSVTEDRISIMKSYNEQVLKVKGKTLTIDQAKGILVPVDKGR